MLSIEPSTQTQQDARADSNHRANEVLRSLLAPGETLRCYGYAGEKLTPLALVTLFAYAILIATVFYAMFPFFAILLSGILVRYEPISKYCGIIIVGAYVGLLYLATIPLQKRINKYYIVGLTDRRLILARIKALWNARKVYAVLDYNLSQLAVSQVSHKRHHTIIVLRSPVNQILVVSHDYMSDGSQHGKEIADHLSNQVTSKQ